MRYVLIVITALFATLGHAQAMVTHPAIQDAPAAHQAMMPCCEDAQAPHGSAACAVYLLTDAPETRDVDTPLRMPYFIAAYSSRPGAEPAPPTAPPRPV
ncbi:hypothetical protein DC366_06125 [Pelagivirga sediminicola]|uniref:Uncharacterized protein n=1 Tax=Pelagivirga sediminicola TaxID=2170575 RepID=A0A2T7GA77_9RHOB|nr:hypothetical protein [Pelagivirga sediminicola]PVA11313.1 hypothetical protein DC366_06125 [Pelagivirga sediminicola]